MIRSLSHTTLFVLDQERAKQFYVDKLGFEVKADQTMGGFRWLTVAPRAQTGIELVLMPVGAGPRMDEAAAKALRGLVEKGALVMGVLATADCKKTYEELAAKGVQFLQPPSERPYGIEALLRDDSGNVFSLTQRR